MKSFRKTLQESRLKTHHLIRSWLQPKLGAVGTKYRLAGRIRLANIWARKHPRRTFAMSQVRCFSCWQVLWQSTA